MIGIGAFCFLYGICIGSFVNVVIGRLPQKISFVKGRSFCPICKQNIAWYDLLPIISYMMLKGKCRICRGNILIRYMLIELVGGMFALLCAATFSNAIQGGFAYVIGMILLTISVIDMDTMCIPNRLLLILSIPIAMVSILQFGISIEERLFGFFIVSLPMYVCNRLFHDSFGGGDIKLIALCGFFLGWQRCVVAACIAVILGGISAIYLLIYKNESIKLHIPFGPYLSIGVMLSLFYGYDLIEWYIAYMV